MFTSLAVTLALGAPVPAPPPAVPSGNPPRVMELKPDADGKIMLTIIRMEIQKIVPLPAPPGAPAPVPPPARDAQVTRIMTVELGDVKELTIATADGKKVELDDALKRLSHGAVVVITSDGKPVSPMFLKVFKDDTLVLSSPELAATFTGRSGSIRTGPIRIAPAPAEKP